MHNTDAVNALIIVFTAVGAALITISGTMLIVALAGGPGTTLLIGGTMVAALVASVIAKWVLPPLADDVSDIFFDTLILDAPVAPGVTFDRTIAIEGVLLGLQDTFNGKYQAAVHWLTQ